MSYETDERLKGYLDTNQLSRERMCRSILATDRRFTEVQPRHPRGGRDGGRDIEAIFRDSELAFGAVGFVNQANDSNEQKKSIKEKFESDLNSAVTADKKPSVFVFFTNINLTVGEKDTLVEKARNSQISTCEIWDRERIKIALDSPDGFSIRFQYLNIALSEPEQASFFARWGDDIQSVISTGFQRIEGTLNRVLFLQEYSDPLSYLTVSFELDEKYPAERIGHFRLFCTMVLKEPKHKILEILFGASDKSNRMRNDLKDHFASQPSGIKHGISAGQWEQYINLEQTEDNAEEQERFKSVGSSSSIGRNEIEYLPITYSKDSLIRFYPNLTLRDLDEAFYLFLVNKSLAEKIKAIHVFSNGYKLQEITDAEFRIDETEFDSGVPVEFTEEELRDPWVRVRPGDYSSTFTIRFFDETPTRMSVSSQTVNSQANKGT